MVESKRVSNPLTIVAIFAGLAELSGTAVLPLLSEVNQGIFMYFVMGFPTLLVLLFFGVLVCKHKVLYAPSDFRSDEAFHGQFQSIRDNAVTGNQIVAIDFNANKKTQSSETT